MSSQIPSRVSLGQTRGLKLEERYNLLVYFDLRWAASKTGGTRRAGKTFSQAALPKRSLVTPADLFNDISHSNSHQFHQKTFAEWPPDDVQGDGFL